MSASTFDLQIPVSMTRSGYWLYVWEVTYPNDQKILYVGRTGDDSNATANPPIVRMGQHFDPNGTASLLKNLREHLTRYALRQGLDPRDYIHNNPYTDLRIIVHGPLFPPPRGNDVDHEVRKAVVGPLERALKDALVNNGYVVVGSHPTGRNLCHRCWKDVRRAFGKHFELANEYPPNNQRPDHPCSQHA